MGKWFFVLLSFYFLEPQVAYAKWSVSALSGTVTAAKKPVQKNASVFENFEVHGAPSSSVTFKQGGEFWTFKFHAATTLRFESQDDNLVFKLISGSLTASGGTPTVGTPSVVVDFGNWRLRKNSGVLKIHASNGEAWVSNEKGTLWAKTVDEDVNTAQEIPEALQFKIQKDDLIYAFEKIEEHKVVQNWKLQVKEKRRPASKKTKIDCASPAGNFEQCAWKCFGQKIEKNKTNQTCDTGSSKVHCVRFTCAADGQWKMPTLMPGGECLGSDARIDQCQ